MYPFSKSSGKSTSESKTAGSAASALATTASMVSVARHQTAGSRSSFDDESSANQFAGYTPQEPKPFELSNAHLPAPNASCYKPPAVPSKGLTKYENHEEPLETKTVDQNFDDIKTLVRDNVTHHTHYKPIHTIVNRNHWHKLRVVDNDHHYHHYLTDNVVKVNDIHHIEVEYVKGDETVHNDYKDCQLIEPAECHCDDSDNSAKSANDSAFIRDDDESRGGAIISHHTTHFSTRKYSNNNERYERRRNNY